MLEWARRNGARDGDAAERLLKQRYLAFARRQLEALQAGPRTRRSLADAAMYGRQVAELEAELGVAAGTYGAPPTTQS